jgi:hypothetical protein
MMACESNRSTVAAGGSHAVAGDAADARANIDLNEEFKAVVARRRAASPKRGRRDARASVRTSRRARDADARRARDATRTR